MSTVMDYISRFSSNAVMPRTKMAGGPVVQPLVYTRTAIDKDQISRHNSLKERFTGLDMSSTKKSGRIIRR